MYCHDLPANSRNYYIAKCMIIGKEISYVDLEAKAKLVITTEHSFDGLLPTRLPIFENCLCFGILEYNCNLTLKMLALFYDSFQHLLVSSFINNMWLVHVKTTAS